MGSIEEPQKNFSRMNKTNMNLKKAHAKPITVLGITENLIKTNERIEKPKKTYIRPTNVMPNQGQPKKTLVKQIKGIQNQRKSDWNQENQDTYKKTN